MIERKIVIMYFLSNFLLTIVFGEHSSLTDHTTEVTLYSEINQTGEKVTVSILKCTNVPMHLVRQVSSIHTHGNCARLWDGLDCAENSIELLPRSPVHSNLSFYEFDKKTTSVGPCRDPCDKEVTGIPPVHSFEIRIYTKEEFNGLEATVDVVGCVPVPNGFVRRVLSVNTDNHCIQLYRDTKCKSEISIALRPEMPLQNRLSYWGLDYARSISHCSFKCQKQMTSHGSNGVGDVFVKIRFHDETNFEGNYKDIRLNRCFTLSSEWKDTARSLSIPPDTCVKLYQDEICEHNRALLQSSVNDLQFKVGSVSPCSNLSNSRPLKPSDSNMNMPNLFLFVILPIVFLVIFLVAVIVFIVKIYIPYRLKRDKLSEVEILEFMRGLGYNNDYTLFDEEQEFGSVENVAQHKPYDATKECSRTSFAFDPKNPLGSGAFGVVYKGFFNQVQNVHNSIHIESIPVAVKTTKPFADVTYLRSLLKEVKVMLYIGTHPRVVEIVGCCTENLQAGEIFVLMEYCAQGSLEKFLQKNRFHFNKRVHSLLSQNITAVDSWQFGFRQLLVWCVGIADGMTFLESKKVIHGDLATRNILMNDNYEVKISDFGLARQLYTYAEYVKKRQEPLPWRWLAPETLRRLEFTTHSDIWSFGVLCWEIFTLGEKPYPEFAWNEDFLSAIEGDMRLTQPKHTTSDCYSMMMWCWALEPNQRPSFSDVLAMLQEILHTTVYQHLKGVNQDQE